MSSQPSHSAHSGPYDACSSSHSLPATTVLSHSFANNNSYSADKASSKSDVATGSSQKRRGRPPNSTKLTSDCPPNDPPLHPPSPFDKSIKIVHHTDQWVLALSRTTDMSDHTNFNATCECGGGSYLGSIHKIAMYENHRKIECITKPEKQFIPYLIPSYFDMLKILESMTTTYTEESYKSKVTSVMFIWYDYLASIQKHRDLFTGTHVFIHYAANELAVFILDRGWDEIDQATKNNFKDVLYKTLHVLQDMKCHPEAVKSCHFLLSLIDEPWSHHYLPILFYGKPSQEEVIDFIEYEKSDIITLRLKILCEGNCETEALKLSSLVVNLYKKNEESRYHFRKEDIEFIRDIYFGCLHLLKLETKLGDELNEFISENNSKVILKSYSSKINSLLTIPQEDRPRICENLAVVYELAACYMIINNFNNPDLFDQFYELFTIWCTFMLKLMKSNFKSNVNNSWLMELIISIMDLAPKSKYLYAICDIAFENFGPTFSLSLYLEMYIKALHTNINEKEINKLTKDKQCLMNSITELTHGYLKLASLLENIVSIKRECVLTAFSLMPSKNLMDQIQKLAIESGKLSSEHLTDGSENSNDTPSKDLKDQIQKLMIKSGKLSPEHLTDVYENSSENGSIMNITSIDSNIQNNCNTKTYKSDQISKTEIIYGVNDSYTIICRDLDSLQHPLLSLASRQNLISVLNYPRYGSFNWNLEWPKLKKECQDYLDNLDTFIGRNLVQTQDLKYVNMDTNEYNKLSEVNRKNVTNNTEHFSSDDESIAISTSSSEEIVDRNLLKKNVSKKPRSSQKITTRRNVSTRKQSKDSTRDKSKKVPLRKKKPKVNFQKRQNLRSQKS